MLLLCSKNEYTKSESNSQLRHVHRELQGDCVQRTNIQNLKAIHNIWCGVWSWRFIVFKERIYKIWKQFTTEGVESAGNVLLCSKNEYTKSESNSQPRREQLQSWHIVFKERIYKIWKQFTTHLAAPYPLHDCVQRTNIQNLKAIHNGGRDRQVSKRIVFKERIYKIWKQFTTGSITMSIFRPFQLLDLPWKRLTLLGG